MSEIRRPRCAADVSDHELHAWVDGELVEPERSQCSEAVIASPAVAARVNELQTLKALLNLAYSPETLPCCPDTAQRHKTGSHN